MSRDSESSYYFPNPHGSHAMPTERVIYEQPEGETITLSSGESVTIEIPDKSDQDFDKEFPDQVLNRDFDSPLYSKAQFHSYKIMGAFFRARAGTPAVAILKILPVATPLLLRPEPTNAVHSKAIAIYLQMKHFPELNPEQLKAFRNDIARSGFQLNDVTNATEHHLGYIPRDVADQLELPGDTPAELAFDLDGKPKVSFQL